MKSITVRNWIGLTLLTGILAACATIQPKPVAELTETERINIFFEQSYDKYLLRHPMDEAYIGGKRNKDKLDDISEAAAKREIEIIKIELNALEKYDYAKLDEQAKLSYRMFVYLAEKKLRDYQFRLNSYPLNPMFGAQNKLPAFMMNMHPIENVKDAVDYIARLQEFDPYFEQILLAIKKRETAGVVPPKFVYKPVIGALMNVLKGAPFTEEGGDSPLMADFRKKVQKIELQKKNKEALLNAAKDALLNSVGPALTETANYMAALEKRAPVEAGATRLPNGKEFYQFALRKHTTTNMSAREVHETGLREVARIHGEMREIMKKVGFEGSLQDFFKHMRTSQEFRYSDHEKGRKAYLADATKFIDDMKLELPKLFNILPKANLEVRPVEAYREKATGLAFYEIPSEDGTRPGIYYVNLSNMQAVNKYEMEALAYHEGIPGHHMQLAISSELKGIPRFRKYSWITAYGEGWGLYTELLPKEIGKYEDPYSDFGRLSMELWRAVRLVVDTGLHWKGWSRENTINYIMANTSAVREAADKATQRYLVWPGQATSYKIGMLKIQDMRAKAEKALGTKFDIRGFHDEYLRHGGLPLALVEENIRKWVAKNGGVYPEKRITISKPASSVERN